MQNKKETQTADTILDGLKFTHRCITDQHIVAEYDVSIPFLSNTNNTGNIFAKCVLPGEKRSQSYLRRSKLPS